MSKTYRGKGDKFTYKNPGADLSADDVVAFEESIGVCETDITSSANGTLSVIGVFDLAADTSTAFSVGDVLYWSTSGEKLTKTDTDVRAGICAKDKAASGAVGRVKIG